MKQIVILGSTGSIGCNALEVVRNFPKEFCVRGLSTHTNVEVLARQAKEFHPSFVCVGDSEAVLRLRQCGVPRGVKILVGAQGLLELLKDKNIGQVVLAISGASALLPLVEALKNGLDIALANKEALVMAGPLIARIGKVSKGIIVPVDSEQSAIWQCLRNEKKAELKTIYLTASGGPLRLAKARDLAHISKQQVLKHPRWKMGKKITVDSATLMNKGFEVLEAMFLFDIAPGYVKVVIHPEAIIHSMVEFVDGVILAQLSVADMRIPIQYALSYPKRLATRLAGVDFFKLKEFHFEKPDIRRFPCLDLAYQAARDLGSMPAVMNAANEACVSEFLNNNLKFIKIPFVIEKVMARHKKRDIVTLKDVMCADAWARSEALRVIEGVN